MTEEWKCSTELVLPNISQQENTTARQGKSDSRVQHISLSPLISASCYEVIPNILAGQTVIPSAFWEVFVSLTTWSQSCKDAQAQGTVRVVN